MIIIDNAGYQFIDSANESEVFRESGLEIKFFDFNTEKQGIEYDKELKKVKRAYSPKDNIVNKIIMIETNKKSFLIRSDLHRKS